MRRGEENIAIVRFRTVEPCSLPWRRAVPFFFTETALNSEGTWIARFVNPGRRYQPYFNREQE